jgi:hypothetical protein
MFANDHKICQNKIKALTDSSANELWPILKRGALACNHHDKGGNPGLLVKIHQAIEAVEPKPEQHLFTDEDIMAQEGTDTDYSVDLNQMVSHLRNLIKTHEKTLQLALPLSVGMSIPFALLKIYTYLSVTHRWLRPAGPFHPAGG